MTSANRPLAVQPAGNTRALMASGGLNGGSPRRLPIPHVEDLIRVPDDIEPNLSIKRLLELAETALRQSFMSREYNARPFSLKDYMRAYTIAVVTIPQHRDFPTMKATSGDAARAHRSLLKMLKSEDSAYEAIKNEVIADNKRTGVRPTVKRSEEPIKQNGHAHASPTKSKPAVQPKPVALHGNAITTGHGSKPNLEARLANLKGPQSFQTQAQDPRINTRTIETKPAGPRAMPAQKPTIDPHPAMPALPKMPEAIYSPARSNTTGETAGESTSAPRGTFARTTSSAIVTTTGQEQQQQQRPARYGVPQDNNKDTNTSRPSTAIPEGNQITPQQLLAGMKQASILIIDIRDREDFNEGHIMSSSTICIEPSVLSREGISASEISESLVVSPGREEEQFNRRDEYDFVVFYDEASDEIRNFPRNADDRAIASLNRALLDLSYGCELQNPPKILKGGLEGWVELMGRGSLKSVSEPSNTLPRRQVAQGAFGRRGSRYVSKPLNADDAKGWESLVAKDQQLLATAHTDFLRRFPEHTVGKESMTSPASTQIRSGYGSSHQADLDTDLPAPPKRPDPAVHRQSYSTLDRGADGQGDSSSLAVQAVSNGDRYVTGLNNPHNWCYANSTLQSLLASPQFGRELGDSTWVTKYTAPRKHGEKIDHPQLMMRLISNLFHWMGTGKFKTMKAQTLMDYSRHLCKSNMQALQFGGSMQQDAQEFMSFLMTELHDETNSARDRNGQAKKPDTRNQSLLQAASQFWASHLEYNNSIVDRHWRGLELSTVQCLSCRNYSYTFSPFEWVPVPLSTRNVGTLEEALQGYNADNDLEDFACDGCGKRTHAKQRLSLARMPELLCLSLRRFAYNQTSKDVKKSTALISWDLNDVDMTPYFLAGQDKPSNVAAGDMGFQGPFRYECYAIIVHAGSRIDTGHYYSYIRDSSTRDPHAWLCCNDTTVTRVRIGSRHKDDIGSRVFKEGKDAVPYLLFFRRKGGA